MKRFVRLPDGRCRFVDDEWVTMHPNGREAKGQPVKIDGAGRIVAGMGGKFKGKKLSEVGKKGASSAPKAASGAGSKAAIKKSGAAKSSATQKIKPTLKQNSGKESIPPLLKAIQTTKAGRYSVDKSPEAQKIYKRIKKEFDEANKSQMAQYHKADRDFSTGKICGNKVNLPQAEALSTWSEQDQCEIINGVLWKGRVPSRHRELYQDLGGKAWFNDCVKDIKAACQANQIKQDCTLYRGVPKKFLDSCFENGVYTSKGFCSASMALAGSESFGGNDRVTIVFNVRAGTKAVSLHSHGSHESELEILFPPGTKGRLVGKSEDGETYFVDLEKN